MKALPRRFLLRLTALRRAKDLVAVVQLVNDQDLALSFQLGGFTKADTMMS